MKITKEWLKEKIQQTIEGVLNIPVVCETYGESWYEG